MILLAWIFIILFSPILMQSVSTRDVVIGMQATGDQHRNESATFIDPCVSAPCLNAGTCIVPPTRPYSYTCQCVPGFTGATCHKGLDECAGNPCANGVCVDNIGSFRCQCHPGFTGELCDSDIDECQNSPCYNGGSCQQPVPGLYACHCPRGYRGFRCQTDIDECMALSPCQNGGLCRQGPPGTYHCSCLPGFSGSDCEHKSLQCSSRPCLNGGQCVEGQGFHRFQCLCDQGRLCEKAAQVIDVCTRNVSVCGRRGQQCVPSTGAAGDGGYRCLCSDGVVTTNQPCRHQRRNGRNGGVTTPAVSDRCQSSPCQNDGRCKSGPQGSYRCECHRGYTGAVCQTVRMGTTCGHSVNNYTCKNGGICFEPINGHLRCICPQNYTGDRCEVPFNQCTNGSNPCLNNSTCTYNLTDGRVDCLCLHNSTGERCQIRDTNSTLIKTRGIPFIRSIIDPTLLIVILSTLGSLALLVGVAMLCVYFRRKRRPRDSCFSVPEPYRQVKPDTTSGPYSTWITNSDTSFDGSEMLPQCNHLTLPRISLYQSSQRRF